MPFGDSLILSSNDTGPVVQMISLQWPTTWADDFHNFSVTVASEVSGCEPKLRLRRGTTAFLFKPSSVGKVMNELIAYHVDQLFGFRRVPPVLLEQVMLSAVEDALLAYRNVTTFKLSCSMNFVESRERWIIHNHSEKGPVVIGTRQILIPGVRQRSEMDRFVNKHLASGRLEMTPTIFGQREIDTRSMFQSLLGNWDSFNNDFSVTQSFGTRMDKQMNILVYIDNNGLSRNHPVSPPQFCRFYHSVVDSLRSIDDPQKKVLGRILAAEPLAEIWIERKLIRPQRDLLPLYWINERRRRVLTLVDECIEKFGFHHVFTAQ